MWHLMRLTVGGPLKVMSQTGQSPVKTFVKNNAGLLDMLADEKISFATFIQRMKT
jgi:hypothetical protein